MDRADVCEGNEVNGNIKNIPSVSRFHVSYRRRYDDASVRFHPSPKLRLSIIGSTASAVPYRKFPPQNIFIVRIKRQV